MVDGGLALQLLGTFRATVDGTSITGFPSDKARAPLAYLTVEGDRPHSRASLATLLWPNTQDEGALGNLRKTLHRLHAALLPARTPAGETVLITSRHDIQLNGAACTADVTTFQALLRAVEVHPHPSLHLCDACLDELGAAVALYRGELLAGLGLPDAEPFEEWLMLKRERLLHMVLGALYSLAGAHLVREEYEQAYTYAIRQVELDGGREEAHRQVMRALALGGQRAEARAYLPRARQILLDTLGVEPAPETVALAAELQAKAAPVERAAPVRHNLPLQLTPFVGRERELHAIANYLREPESRLLSIVGPGGMGKTRLALKAAEGAAGGGRFADGIIFIALAEVRLPELLPAALLAGLGLQPQGPGDPRAQLLQSLAPRDYLLVLDSMDHVLDGAGLLVDILISAPGVRLLVTSRLPLGLLAEQRVPLEGLDYREPSGELVTSGATAAGEIAGLEGVRLFVQAMRRVDPNFRLTDANAGDVLRICRMVDGMPLALELAAPWISVMDCAAIAGAIERNLDLLVTTAHDVPDRQRSIEGVFAQTWELLPGDEQDTLARLSVFRGPFNLEAAVQVAGASTVELAILLDRALLHRRANGRYGLHDLLRQFAQSAAGDLPGLDLDVVHARHSDYYLGLVADSDPALHGPDPRIAVDALLSHLAGVQQAWSWTAEQGQPGVLTAALEGMVRFWELTSEFETADVLLALAAQAVQRRLDSAPAHRDQMTRLLIRLLVWQAHFAGRRDRIDDAIRLAQTALACAERAEDLEGEAMASGVLGEVLPHRQEFAEAITRLRQACAYFEGHDRRRWLAQALRWLGIAHWRHGEYEPAAECIRRAQVVLESLGDRWQMAHISSVAAALAFEQGDEEEGLVGAERSLKLYQATGDRQGVAFMHGNLATVYLQLGRFDLGLHYNLSMVETMRERGNLRALAVALGNRGSILQETGKLDESRACFEEALQIAEEVGDSWDEARYRAFLARLAHLRGECDLALAQFEQALPVLRAGQVPYYTVGPLLDAAELELDRGRVKKAAQLAREGTSLARNLGRADELLRGQALEARVASAGGERDRSVLRLQELLDTAGEDAHVALLHFELWRLCQGRAHAEAALRLYRHLYERTPRHLYRSRIEELAG